MSEGIDTAQNANTQDPKSQTQGAKNQAQAPVAAQTPQGKEGNPISDAANEVLKKYRVKVDGQDLEVDEKELLRGYSHQKAANKILQEGKAKAKEAESLLSQLKEGKGVFDLLKTLGHDPRKMTEEYLSEQLKYEMLDEREKALIEKDKKLKEYEERDKKAEEEKRKAIEDAAMKKYSQQYSEEIVSALKESSVPQNKDSVQRIAKYLAQSAKFKIQMTAQEAVKLVEQDLLDVQSRIYKDMSAEQLLKFLGEDGFQKIRSYDAQKIRTPEQNLSTPNEQGKINNKKKGPWSMQEWRAYNRK